MTTSMLAAVARKRAGGAPPFSPTDIAGCKLWLDASQIGGLSDTDPIATWTNLGTGGSGLNAVQSDASKRPLYRTGLFNSLPGVEFPGVDEFFSMGDYSALTAATVFIVLKTNAAITTGTSGLWDFGAGGSDGTYYPFPGDGKIYEAFGTTLRFGSIVPGVTLSDPQIYSVTTETPNWTMRFNGTQVYTNGTSVTTFPASNFLGKRSDGSPWNGYAAEVIIYDSALGTTDCQTVETYLAGKYII